MSNETKPKAVFGCAVGLWSLCVTSPMWLLMLYQILTTINATQATWILFWCYVPAQLLGCVLYALFKLLVGDDA